MRLYWEKLLMVCHRPQTFGGHRQCGSGDIMFLVVKKEDSSCSRFNPLLLFISVKSTWVEYARHILYQARYLSHYLKAKIGEKSNNNFYQSVQKKRRKGKREVLAWQLQSFSRYTVTQKSGLIFTLAVQESYRRVTMCE